jgi:hypothetical protein
MEQEEREPRDLEPRDLEQRDLEQRGAEETGAYRMDYAQPSVEREQAEVAQSSGQTFAEPETGPAAPVPPVSAPAAPRRGSTVREPAPTSLRFGGEFGALTPAAPAEPEQPVPSDSTESDDASRPRRAGWWSKRVLGKG